MPAISVIVPAYNCQTTIGKAIAAILAQEAVDGFEVIVVDDGSTDATAQIVGSFPVKYTRQENAGPARARNAGARQAQGEILFFTDSDCVPHKDWIAIMMPYFHDPHIGVVCGSYGIANPKGLLARCIHQEIVYSHKNLMPEFPKVFGSYNFCVRKKVFEIAGGFNADYRHASGEDNDLSYKILSAGHKIYFARQSLVDHFHPTKLGKYLKEQYRHGFWRVKMYLAHPRMARGDDYTFWKDILEIPISLLVLLFLVLGIFRPNYFGWAGVVILGLAGLEVFFALGLGLSFGEALFFALVMGLRAAARALGFITGSFYFGPEIFKDRQIK